MTELRSKSLQKPDETVLRPGVTVERIEFGDLIIGRTTHQPGWRWSTHMRPLVGGDSCQARHIGVVLSGRFGVTFKSGPTFEFGPLDVFDIPPGHDGFTIGDEPCVVVEWSGVHAFVGQRPSRRLLTSVLITDLVDSTTLANQLGDQKWRALLSAHFQAARAELDRHGGHEIKTTGDGLLATFDSPAAAIACASAIGTAARRDGLQIRAGVHVGEVEIVGQDIRGVVVHEAARIMAEAGPNEVMVSETTRNLALGAGLMFEDRGLHELKGLPGKRRLFAYVVDAGPQAD
jgi:class 3 adenylate cyclase